MDDDGDELMPTESAPGNVPSGILYDASDEERDGNRWGEELT